MSPSAEQYYIGIDVGTGSARAVLVIHTGELVRSHTHPIQTWRVPTNAVMYEQSTSDIWDSICLCVKAILNESGINKKEVKGIGFDATCSLAVVDLEGKSVCVSEGAQLGKEGERDIVLWMDHRAEEEANLINKTEDEVLKYVGGTMSLEMEIPKILWLKKRMPAHLFARCQFFDLPDYLTYKATSSSARSNCSLVCKCSFIPPSSPNSSGWSSSFLTNIGLEDLVQDGFRRAGGGPGDNGNMVLSAGQPVGTGLTREAAIELGFGAEGEGIAVGSGVIDAYAGWIGSIAARDIPYRSDTSSTTKEKLTAPPTIDESQHRLAAVAGTSTCHLIQNPNGSFVPGVWGPYKNAIFPGWWMAEGGQSSTGQLIDFIITSHPAYNELLTESESSGRPIHSILEDTLEKLRIEAKAATLTELTRDIHFYPDLHGNRTPLADPQMRGSITGLTLDVSLNDLAVKYNVTLEAIALQTRHILDEMNTHGHDIKGIYMSGGQAKNIILMNLLANTCNISVILPHSHSAAVVAGAAMLGRVAYQIRNILKGGELKSQRDVDECSAKFGGTLWDIMVEMTQPGQRIAPSAGAREKRLLEAKYKIFRESIEIQRKWKKEINEAMN